MTSRRNQLALAATLTGALAAAGTTLATKRAVRAQRRRPDPEARTIAAAAPADRVRTVRTVRTEDGLNLHVEETGPLDAPVTVIFAHGWVCTQEAWVYQRRDLAGDDIRLVFYDQRGHGRSGRPDPQHTDVDILGRDLGRILESCSAAGKVVLVGHSMGGMTIMALADQRPELFGPGGVIGGVALLATSAGSLATVTLGVPVAIAKITSVVMPHTYKALARFGDRLDGRRKPTDFSWMFTKYVSFGGDVPPSLVELMERMVAQAPLATAAGFGTALLNHDKLQALPVLAGCPTLILVGDRDVLTPVDHSRAMADAVPTAELVVLPGCGHLVMLERPSLTTLHLRTLLSRVGTPAATA